MQINLKDVRRKLRCLQTRRRRRTKEERKKGPTSDSPTLRLPDSLTDINASIQKTNSNSLQAVVEIEQRKASESSQELDVGLQLDDTGQVTEYHLDDKKVKESNERASKANKLWNWWRNMWTAPRDTQSNDIEEKEVKHKAPDKATRL